MMKRAVTQDHDPHSAEDRKVESKVERYRELTSKEKLNLQIKTLDEKLEQIFAGERQ